VEAQAGSATLATDSSNVPLPRRLTAVCVDVQRPKSADVVAASMLAAWPSLAGRWHYVEAPLASVVSHPSTLLVGWSLISLEW
jgi:hypothetical protein